MYKVFLNFPDALRPAFPKLKEKLEVSRFVASLNQLIQRLICRLQVYSSSTFIFLFHLPIFFTHESFFSSLAFVSCAVSIPSFALPDRSSILPIKQPINQIFQSHLRSLELLQDPDPGVQSAAVNVICELARKNPKNYLSLAPTFFKLMTSSTNNWVLIKIIKLFGALTPLEPRLGKYSKNSLKRIRE